MVSTIALQCVAMILQHGAREMSLRKLVAEAVGRARMVEADAVAMRRLLEQLLPLVPPDDDGDDQPGGSRPADIMGFTKETFSGCKTAQSCVYLIDDLRPGLSPHEVARILRELELSATITPASASSMRSRRPKL
jgi:hypothetical protein